MKSKVILLSCLVICSLVDPFENIVADVDPRFDVITDQQYELLRQFLLGSAGTLTHTQKWGNRSPINATVCNKDSSLNQLHVGVDYGANVGTPVLSATPGRVERINRGSPCSNSDQCLSTLVSYHEATQTSFIYLHMKTIDLSLQRGDLVSMGQLLGTVGARGRVTGSHLHFEARHVNSEPFQGIKTAGALCIDGTINPFGAVMMARSSQPSSRITVASENFEGQFPHGNWRAFDNDASTNGEYYWAKESYRPRTGQWSAYCVRGGRNGISAPGPYPNNAQSWMLYGPFSLKDATDAGVDFYYWLRTERGRDTLGWLASID